MQRSGIPLLIAAAIFLIGAAAAVYGLYWPLWADAAETAADEPDPTPAATPEDEAPAPEESVGQPTDVEPADESSEDEAPATESAAEAPEPVSQPDRPAVDPNDRAILAEHTVRWGDNFYVLAARYWANAYLWPDLYAVNADTFADPDFMLPGQSIMVPESVLADGSLSDADVTVLSEAHVIAYERYRRLADVSIAQGRESGIQWLITLGNRRLNKAHWVLYSGLRYNVDLLEEYAHRISAADRQAVQAYLNKYGRPQRRE